MILRDVELRGRTRTDVRVTGGAVTETGPDLPRHRGEDEITGHGGALLPGLCDHHLHLHALAAARAAPRCGPPDVTDPVQLGAVLRDAPADEHGWVRGTGYTDTVAGDIDAVALDRIHPHRPVRIQHRSGALWMTNTLGATRLGLATADHPGIERGPHGTPTGRLWRADHWLRTRLPHSRPPHLDQIGAALTAHGITAVTDATPDLDHTALHALRRAVTTGALPQQLHLLGVPLGTEVTQPRLTTGPYKIVLADSGLPAFDDLTARIRHAHRAGRAIAAHCVTREALLLLLAALDDAGTRAGDRIEHAALVPTETIADLARRGLTVVTQPGFLSDRGDDYLRDLDAAEHPDLYRCESLRAAGVPLALSSDAPYGPLDPWAVLAAAIRRRTPDGTVTGTHERLTAHDALAALLTPPEHPGGPPRRIHPGTAADLLLLDRPLRDQLAAPTTDAVHAVLISGRLVHRR